MKSVILKFFVFISFCTSFYSFADEISLEKTLKLTNEENLVRINSNLYLIYNFSAKEPGVYIVKYKADRAGFSRLQFIPGRLALGPKTSKNDELLVTDLKEKHNPLFTVQGLNDFYAHKLGITGKYGNAARYVPVHKTIWVNKDAGFFHRVSILHNSDFYPQANDTKTALIGILDEVPIDKTTSTDKVQMNFGVITHINQQHLYNKVTRYKLITSDGNIIDIPLGIFKKTRENSDKDGYVAYNTVGKIDGFARFEEQGQEYYMFRAEVGLLEHTLSNDHSQTWVSFRNPYFFAGDQFVILRNDGKSISYFTNRDWSKYNIERSFGFDYTWASNKNFIQIGNSNLLLNLKASTVFPNDFSNLRSVHMQFNFSHFEKELSEFSSRLIQRQNYESQKDLEEQKKAAAKNKESSAEPRKLLPVKSCGKWIFI